MRILVTGDSGFIGHHVCMRLLQDNHEVTGVSIPSTQTQRERLEELASAAAEYQFSHHHWNIGDDETSAHDAVEQLGNAFDCIIHLAAKPGVRESFMNPQAYYNANVKGFGRVLEFAKAQANLKHLVYASSSSVYGDDGTTNRPRSLYAATKKMNELQAGVYADTYQLPVTGLRYFTVYGPWMRDDLAVFKFTKAIFADEPLQIYCDVNSGGRDYTYIDDVVEATMLVMDRGASATQRIFDVGTGVTTPLTFLIGGLEFAIGRKAKAHAMGPQRGDVIATRARTTELYIATRFQPSIQLGEGLQKFVAWYRWKHEDRSTK
jgi:UDP-glucuronate 4-epimerase